MHNHTAKHKTTHKTSSRIKDFDSTIFAEMSKLAMDTGAINLGQGFPDFDGPREVLDAAIAAIEAGHNQYPPGIGIAPLRNAVAKHQKRFYDLDVDPETEVLITAGATEAITASLLSLCEVGDEVIAFEPFYDSYAGAISMAGGKRLAVTLNSPELYVDNSSTDKGSTNNASAAASAAGKNTYTYDFDQLEELCSRKKARIMILNSPHNPTGKVFSIEELKHIAGLAQKHNLLVITDEVYEHLVYEGSHIPIATLPGMLERTVTISSGGKTFSTTGWKIGWVHSTPELTKAIRMAKQFLTYVNGTPFQYAIATGLELADEYFEELTKSFRAKRDLLCSGLADAGFTHYKPAGTYFVTADVSSLGVKDGMEFCWMLPKKCGVVAVPNVVFYDNKEAGKNLVRFTFSKQNSILSEAVEKLKQFSLSSK